MSKSVLEFGKLMFTDVDPLRQPKGTYRYAQNATAQSVDGDYYDITNELGNIECASLPEGYTMLGSKLDNENKKILILNNKQYTIIGEIDQCNFKTLIKSSCFEYDDNSPIDIEMIVKGGCNRFIYMVSKDKPMYSIDLDSLHTYVDPVLSDEVDADPLISDKRSEKILRANNEDRWSCNLFKVFRDINIPTIDLESVNNTGGNLQVGSYFFSIRLLDQSLNPTSWLNITPNVPIVFDSLNSDYDIIQGGTRGTGTGIDDGYNSLPPTTKSISLRLGNLDRNFTYYQIGVALINDGLGSPSGEVRVSPVREITSDSDIFIFTGSIDGFETTTLEELTTPLNIIDSAEHIEQIDGKIVIVNGKGLNIDITKFQRKANDIRIKYVVKQLNKNDIEQSGKSAEYYWYYTSYMRDEVYAIGIVWVLKDGRKLPTIHVSGRPKDSIDTAIGNNQSNGNLHPRPFPNANQWDSTNVFGYGGTENIETCNSPLERWEVWNTALKDDTPKEGYYSSGEMGYYESCENYPNILDCDGNRVFPEGKVRHPRMPDTTLEPHQDQNHIYVLGLDLSNVEPPEEYADLVQGYYIVRSRRDEFNKTIFDKGWFEAAEEYGGDPSDPSDEDAYYGYNRLTNIGGTLSDKMYVFHSPRTMFNRDFPSGTHVKLERRYFNNTGTDPGDAGTINFDCDFGARGRGSLWELIVDNEGVLPNINTLNKSIVGTRYLDRRLSKDDAIPSTTFNGERITNEEGSNHILFVRLNTDSTLPYNDDFWYASIKSYRSVYNDLQSIKYYETTNNVLTGNNNIVFGGDIFISRFSFTLQRYYNVQDTVTRQFLSIYVESEINSELRHGGFGEENRWYTGGYDIQRINGELTGDEIAMCDWVKRYTTVQDFIDSGLGWEEFAYKDPWYYNPDFNSYRYASAQFTFSFTRDLCSECQEKFPNRFWVSRQGFLEDTVDFNRVFLALDYYDIPADYGDITDVFVDRDNLYAHTPKALWFIPTKPQGLATNEATIYIRSESAFSIPPKSLISTDYGYGGCVDKWATITTEFGTLFVNRQGKVFLFREGLQEISQDGNANFFENNIDVVFINSFKSTFGYDYPFRTTHNKLGVGYMSTYDPRFRRFIIHKKDYEIINSEGLEFTNNEFKYQNETISLNDKRFFRNRSYTLSYSLKDKGWVCFHSYMPNYMFNDDQTFYSYINNDIVYEHNKGEYTTYYGYKHSFILDMIDNDNPGLEKYFNSYAYISNVKSYDTQNEDYSEIIDVTFDKIWFYNSNQSSLISNININTTAQSSITYSPDSVTATRTNNIWKINRIWDYSVNPNVPVSSKSWSDIQGEFNQDQLGNGYIDKTISNNVLPNKNQYDLARLRGKWMGIRCYFNPSNNYRITVQLSSNTVKESVR